MRKKHIHTHTRIYTLTHTLTRKLTQGAMCHRSLVVVVEEKQSTLRKNFKLFSFLHLHAL